MITKHSRTSRFTLVEMALALAILGVGLSAVLLLSTIGAKAGRDGRTEGYVEGASEQIAVFLRGRFSAPAYWKADGSSTDTIPDFVASPSDDAVPVGSAGFSQVAGYAGVLSKDIGTYISRQSSGADGSNVDFEAMVRVGVDGTFRANQYYCQVTDGAQKKLTEYPKNQTDPPGTRVNGGSAAAMLGKFYRPLIVELSWPIDVEWSKREKRFMRLELFNGNFIPYPQN